MTDRLHITDHALLGWMERVHGIDVKTWRDLMREEAEAALRSLQPDDPEAFDAFVISPAGKVFDFAPKGLRTGSLIGCRPLFAPRVTAPRIELEAP